MFIFIMLSGEYSMNSEYFTVHSGRCAGKKRPAMPVRVVYFAAGSSHFGSQSALLSSLRARLVCMP
ncbi:hypothetical protein F1D31_11190 [Klebsiella pneumoniae]|nr:hypothetical protein F1D31_11190 [Klebsiella pneumoniae]TRW07313.1 hypothetical protein FNY87_10705 [Klebsiella pneumoniae]